MQNKYPISILLLILLSTFFSCSGDEPAINDDKTEQESQNNKDPKGTKTVILTKNSNSTNIIGEVGFYDGIRLDNNNILRITEHIEGKYGQHIQPVGKVKSLSEIKDLPELGCETSYIPNLGLFRK